MALQIIPAVDVLDGAVVRLLRGNYDNVTEYADDPASSVASWVDSGADLVHVVDLGAARSGEADLALWHGIGSATSVFQAAGGIRTAEVARAVVEGGASRVVAGTAAVWTPAVLGAIVTAVGSERVVAAIDVRDGRARGAGWEDGGRPLGDVVAGALDAGAGRLMVTGIATDGTMDGPDLGLMASVVEMSPVPVIASGGVGTLDHLRSLPATGVEAVVVGRALYEGAFSYSEAVTAVSD